MKIELIPAQLPDLETRPLHRGLALGFARDDPGRTVVGDALATIEHAPRPAPWNSYWAHHAGDDAFVGMAAFKTVPDLTRSVEIAYFTFPLLEGRGVATQMVHRLVAIARAAGLATVTARTLPLQNASGSVLTRSGFILGGLVDDPEDGSVWEWRLALTRE